MIYIVSKQNKDFGFPRRTLKEVLNYFIDVHKEIAVDTETTGLEPHTCKLLTIQLGDKINQFVIDCSTIEITLLKNLLENRLLVIHNAKFDLKFLYKHGIVPNKVFCTYLAEAVLNKGDKTVKKSLQAVAKRYLNKELDKSIRGQIIWRGLTPDVIKYAARDVEHLSSIKVSQTIKIFNHDLSNSMRLENEFVKVLAYIEYCGIFLNKELWETKVEKDLKEYKAAEAVLDKWIMDNKLEKYIDPQLDLFQSDRKCAINWQSSHQVIPLLKELGVNTAILNDKGFEKDSANSKRLQLQANKSPFIPLYLHFKRCEKVSTTYNESFIKQINPVTGRIHANFTQVMDTGRLSSGGEKTINLQNIPADEVTRGCFTRSKPTNMLINCDYPGQEQIIFANWTKDSALIDFYRENRGDMHSFIASKVFPELKNIPLGVIKTVYPKKRSIAKTAGFALNYGGNGNTVAQNVGISEEEGNKVYESYFKEFVGVKTYFDRVKKDALDSGYILFNDKINSKSFIPKYKEFLDLKRRVNNSAFWAVYREEKNKNSELFNKTLKPLVRTYFKRKGEIERRAINYPIQGSGAEMTKFACIDIFNQLKNQNLLFKVLFSNVIHDEVLLESPTYYSSIIAGMVSNAMSKAGNYFCDTIKFDDNGKLPIKAEVCTWWKH